jgi:hypothetical protein
MDPFGRDQLPVHVVLEAVREQHRQPDRVRAPPLDRRHGFDDVPGSSTWIGAVVDHLALVHQVHERLYERHQAHVVQGLDTNRQYSRCRMACFDPPVYWSAGIHRPRLRVERRVRRARQYRRKYQDESTNVSMVSVSRRAWPPHDGQSR